MRIRSKLFFMMLLSSVTLVMTMYLLIQWTVDKELIKYINIREQQLLTNVSQQLGQRYKDAGDWSFIRHKPFQFHEIIRQTKDTFLGRPSNEPHFKPPPPRNYAGERGQGFGGERHFRPPPVPRGEQNLSVLDHEKNLIVGPYRASDNNALLPIKSDSKLVGWLAFKQRKNIDDNFDLALQDSLTNGFLLISSLLIFLSAAIAMPLSRFFVRRIKALTTGTKAISSGDLTHRVEINSHDEIGELARDFNHLAQTLEQNESARKRWIADISHELRTPLAITSGELEAMEDGVRPLTLENIKSARDEIKHLQRLVNDLYELTNADIGAISYHKTQVDLSELIQIEGEHFITLADKQGLALTIKTPDKPTNIYADTNRLKQLFQNLLGNSLKYTKQPGNIYFALKTVHKGKQHFAHICIEDSSPGVAKAHREKLFEHLYRVEASRNRQTGGSGLGLAICKQIVLAHQGQITAEASDLGGLKITIKLPLS